MFQHNVLLLNAIWMLTLKLNVISPGLNATPWNETSFEEYKPRKAKDENAKEEVTVNLDDVMAQLELSISSTSRLLENCHLHCTIWHLLLFMCMHAYLLK